MAVDASATSAMPRRCATRMRARRARDRLPPGGAAAGAAVLRRAGRTPMPPTSWARCTCSRPCARTASVRAVVDRHHRQVLREPRVGLGLPRERADGRPRSLQQQQGLRRARHRGLPPLVLRASGRRMARRLGARRQRDRRRRLGRRPAGPRHPARLRARRAGASSATRTRSARGSTCSSRWRAICMLAERLCATARAAPTAGTSARATRTPGRCSGSSSACARAGATAPRWQLDAGEQPHEAQLPQARHLQGPRSACGWQPRWSLDEALDRIVDWHRAWLRRRRHAQRCLQQIDRLHRRPRCHERIVSHMTPHAHQTADRCAAQQIAAPGRSSTPS